MLPCSGAVDQAWCLIVHCSERVEALTLVFVHAEWSRLRRFFPPSDLNIFFPLFLGAALVFCMHDNSDYSSLYPNNCLSRASEEKEERKKIIQVVVKFISRKTRIETQQFSEVSKRVGLWSIEKEDILWMEPEVWGHLGGRGPWTSTTLSQNFAWLLWPYLMCRNDCYWVI